LRIPTDQPVELQGHGQAVGGGAGQAGRVLQRGEVERFPSQGAKDENPFVNDADTAYTVHSRESYLRK
jgi:hypothetical protein